MITKRAITYVKAHMDYFVNTADIKHVNIDGAWAERWKRFLASVIDVPGIISQPCTRTSVKPEELFTLSYTQKKFGLDLRSMASLPSNLTGLGITFTFMGLVIGVTSASSSLSNVITGAESNLLAMIEPLLQGAGLAFATSLAGLFGSLVYSVGSQRSANALQVEIDKWNQTLDEICPVMSPAELQMIMITQNEKQVGQMELLPQQVSSSIGDGISQIMHDIVSQMELLPQQVSSGIGDRLSQIMEDIRAGIKERDESSAQIMATKFNRMVEAFNQNISEMSLSFNQSLDFMAHSFDTSINKLTNNFNRSIRQMAGDEMELFANQLKTLHQEYVEAQKQIIEQKDQFLTKSTDHAVHAFNQTNEMAALLEKCTTQIASLTGDIVDHVDGLRDDLDSWVKEEVETSGRLLAETLESAGTIMNRNVDRASQILVSASEESKNLLAETLDSAGTIMTSNADRAGQILVAASEDSKKLLVEAALSITDSCDGMGESMVQGAEQFSQSLESSGDAITRTLANGIKVQVNHHYSDLKQGLNEHIQAQKETWKAHEEALTSIYKSHRNEVEVLKQQMGAAFTHAQEDLKQFGKSTNNYVEGLDVNASQILKTLSRSIDEMQRIQQQLAVIRMKELVAEVA